MRGTVVVSGGVGGLQFKVMIRRCATDQLMKINKISILEWINLYRPINN